jgi:vancomycin resistance protein YoaR
MYRGDIMQQSIELQENKENIKSEKNTKRNIVIVAIILIFIVMSAIGINSFNNKYMYNGKIANNIYVGSLNVSNLTSKEAKELVKNKYKPETMVIDYEGKTFNITPSDIDFKYNINEVIDNAYSFNKTDSYLNNVKRIISLGQGNKKVFEVKSLYSESKLDNYLKNVAKEVNTNVSDAKLYISGSGGFNITPAVVGQEVDIKSSKDAIKKSLDNKKFKGVNLIVKKSEPKISTDMLQSIDSVLATHSTKFTGSSANRAHNIIKSANSTSDILLMPGDEFSYNKSTGPRSKSNGYKDAPVIVNGKLQDGSGGGVCQVSTTIYNSALYSGLDITKVRNHSLPSTYAPMGKDATVSYDYLDLKFKNPYDHPIYIKNTVYNGVLTSKIYGNSNDKQNINIRIEKVKGGSRDVVKTYREFKDSSGNIKKSEYIATSSYKKK